MFWGGFFVGVIFLICAAGLTFWAWVALEKYIGNKVEEESRETGPSKLDVEFLKTDVKFLKNSRVLAIDRRQELRDSLKATDDVVREHEEAIDRLERRVRELQDRIDSFEKDDSPLYYGVILADGCAVHDTPEKGSPISHVLNKDTRVMIYEIKKSNGVNWARVEEEGWIHGGWEYRHPPRIKGAEKG